jgi:hypothetical protein
VESGGAEFIAKLLEIEQDIESLRPREVYLRDSWHPFYRRLVLLRRAAPDRHLLDEIVRVGFMVWELQEARGPKHKEKVRQKLLKRLRAIRAAVEA